LLPAVDVVCCASESCVGHYMYGECGDAGPSDDAPDAGDLEYEQ